MAKRNHKAKKQDKSPVGYSGKGKGKGKGQSNKINRTKKVCTQVVVTSLKDISQLQCKYWLHCTQIEYYTSASVNFTKKDLKMNFIFQNKNNDSSEEDDDDSDEDYNDPKPGPSSRVVTYPRASAEPKKKMPSRVVCFFTTLLLYFLNFLREIKRNCFHFLGSTVEKCND